MELSAAIGIFLVILLVIEGAYFIVRNRLNPEAKEVRQRLKVLSLTDDGSGEVDLVRKRLLSQVPWCNRLLLRFTWTRNMGQLIDQAGLKHSLGFFLMISLLLGLGGGMVTALIRPHLILPAALVLGCIPFLYIHLKKKRRMAKFERQLPETMDLIARALKAGHAFTGGLRLVGEEFGDPIGTEFERTLNEINFGVSVGEAMKNLADRVNCPDLKFFVMSVIIQRETGGNLAEILENIARLIRERFKLQGRVRVLSAEGKLSAVILIAIPFVVAFVLSLLNPGYINTLFVDPIGRGMIGISILMMILGIVVMKKMIVIKV